MKFEELKVKSAAELQKLLAQSREEMRAARFRASKNELKNIRSIRVIKERIARILTILNGFKK
mgnify:CR=1 FL=1